MNLLTKGKSDVHQRIERKARNAAAQQVVDARLGDAAMFRGRGLSPVAFLDQRSDLSHQLGANLEVGGFLGGVGKRIPDAGVPLVLRLFFFFWSWLFPGQLCEALFRQFDVAFRCGLRLLLECMEHVDRIGQAGGVDDAIGAGVVPYPDLFDTLADRWHGFEIVRLQPVLHAVQLVAGVLLRVIGKFPEAIQESPKNSAG